MPKHVLELSGASVCALPGAQVEHATLGLQRLGSGTKRGRLKTAIRDGAA
jgi:hypothetical protein